MESADPVRRVVLVGFMAAGKTTVGRRVARLLGWDFVDFDAIIEARTGMSIHEIFRLRGEAQFRFLEASLTEEFGCADNVVIAPGGGWITRPAVLDAVCPGALLVWLRVSAGEVVRRALLDAVKRPLLAGDDPLEKAILLLGRREPYYRMAHAVVDVDGRGVDDVADEITGLIRVRSDPSAAGRWPDGSE